MDYSYYAYPEETTSSVIELGAGGTIVSLAIAVFLLVSMWKLFTKAGKEGWKSLIPIYNLYTIIGIAGLPGWYLLLFLVPFANIYAMFKIYIELAHKFGKSTGFGVLTVFFPIICIPILAFGSAQYNQSSN